MTFHRLRLARECAALIIGKGSDGPVMHFCTTLEKKLTAIVENAFKSTCATHSKKREKMWAAFYQFRATELCTMWTGMITGLALPAKFKDLWLAQTVSRLVLESSIKSRNFFPSADAVVRLELDMDEHNALRYAAGYVMLSMKKKTSCKVTSDWIKRQVDTDSVTSTTFQDFTKEWITKVNRGGLFCINDELYDVFVAMEKAIRPFLKDMAANGGMEKEKVMDCILDDSELQEKWSEKSDELCEEMGKKLLRGIVNLWVTIRGFSYASALVEEYKRLCGALKRKRAHRKELKRKCEKKKCRNGEETIEQ